MGILLAGAGLAAAYVALSIAVQVAIARPFDLATMTAIASARPTSAVDLMNWVFRGGYAPFLVGLCILTSAIALVTTRSPRLAAIPMLIVLVMGIQTVTRLVVDRGSPAGQFALSRQYATQTTVRQLDQADSRARAAFVAVTGAGDANDQGNGSFPSGHAARAAFVAIALGWWMARRNVPAVARALAIAALSAWALSVGYSALFFGYHWPTDVIGGYVLGGSIGLIGIWWATYRRS